ncbi:MAG: MinD/ParA family protein [Myxococcales bacterium]|nr:MinD/ParA family protein [Myxococcales bacterium]MDD9965682.1 MinD/ParA family protein [Myxococcales bacterium]
MIHMSYPADGAPRGESLLAGRPGGFSERTLTLAVTSGKGGVGKTQVSANLGVALARQGRSVVLVDADLGLASLDLALGVTPGKDMMAVVRGKATLEDILVEGPAGVKLVPACPGRFDMANLAISERQRLAGALRELASGFEVLIIDTGAGIGTNSVEFAALADEILLVVTPEPTSLRDAYAMAKVLHRRNGVRRVQFVANQVANDLEAAEVFDRLAGIVKQFLSLELCYLGCIPRDERVVRAVASGEPYILSAPRSLAARGMDALVRRLGDNPLQGAIC